MRGDTLFLGAVALLVCGIFLIFGFTLSAEPPMRDVAPPEHTVIIPAAAQAPTSNTDAVATLGAFAGRKWNIETIRWSYSAAPTGGQLILAWTDDGSITRAETYYITAAGPNMIRFEPPLTVPATVAPTITLKAGGSGIFGTVYYNANKG